MAQDAKAIVLEGFVVSSLANVLERSVVWLLDIALKGPVSLLDGSEFLLDIANSVAQLPSFKYVLMG